MTETALAPTEQPKTTAPTPPTTKKYSLDEIKDLSKYFSILGAGLYPLIRAMDGLPPEPDPTFGLIDRSDDRETGMLSEDNLNTHVAWDVAAKKWPILQMFDVVRESDLPYEKTLDGNNWKLTAALVGKGQQQPGLTTQINMGLPNQWNQGQQNPDQQQQQGPPKKKHFWSR
jgi:hypothetical protein